MTLVPDRFFLVSDFGLPSLNTAKWFLLLCSDSIWSKYWHGLVTGLPRASIRQMQYIRRKASDPDISSGCLRGMSPSELLSCSPDGMPAACCLQHKYPARRSQSCACQALNFLLCPKSLAQHVIGNNCSKLGTRNHLFGSSIYAKASEMWSAYHQCYRILLITA